MPVSQMYKIVDFDTSNYDFSALGWFLCFSCYDIKPHLESTLTLILLIIIIIEVKHLHL